MNLTKENLREYALRHYANPSCSSLLEFEEDFDRLKYIKILLNKIQNNKELNIRILLNHLISFTNVFRSPAAIQILFFNNDEDTWVTLATSLHWLKRLPSIVRLNDIEIDGREIISYEFLEKLNII